MRPCAIGLSEHSEEYTPQGRIHIPRDASAKTPESWTTLHLAELVRLTVGDVQVYFRQRPGWLGTVRKEVYDKITRLWETSAWSHGQLWDDEDGVPGSDVGLTARVGSQSHPCRKIERSADAPGRCHSPVLPVTGISKPVISETVISAGMRAPES